MEFLIAGVAGERRRLVEAFEEFCRSNQVPESIRQAADLALEEHLTNVLTYGYERGAAQRVVVRIDNDPDWLLVEVEDDGKPYNPLAAPPVDTSVPLAEKPIGGLGIHVIREFMDELSYAHEAGKNVLRMRKRLVSS